LLMNLVRIVQENGGEDEQIFNREINEYKYLSTCKVIDDLFDLIESKCRIVTALLRERKLSQPQKTVRLLKQIAKERYGEDLSLRSIGHEIHIHPVYLGQIFKAS